jgi:hypothetical protein
LSLISVNIPIVENVGETAFCGCSSLKSIDLSNVKTLGNSAFVCCDSLKIVILSDVSYLCVQNITNMSIQFYVLYFKSDTKINIEDINKNFEAHIPSNAKIIYVNNNINYDNFDYKLLTVLQNPVKSGHFICYLKIY